MNRSLYSDLWLSDRHHQDNGGIAIISMQIDPDGGIPVVIGDLGSLRSPNASFQLLAIRPSAGCTSRSALPPATCGFNALPLSALQLFP
jgi:hypothetical protein